MTLILYIIKLYQRISHTFFPKTCRYYPSCSQYAIEAVQKYGVWRGVIRAVLRIFRCSPFFRGGYDPVE